MKRLKVLHIEDNKGDAVLVKKYLEESSICEFEVSWYDTFEDAFKKITPKAFDIVILDLNLPDVVEFEGLSKLRKTIPLIPVVVHTGTTNLEVGMEAIKKGAQDFISKDTKTYPLLAKTVLFAYEKAQQKVQIQKQNNELNRLSQAVDQSENTIVITDTKGEIEFVNKKFTQVTGYSYHEAIGKNPRILKSGKQSKEFYSHMWATITNGRTWYGHFENKRKDGSSYWEKASISPVISSAGEIINYIAVKEDVTALKTAQEDLEFVLDSVNIGSWEWKVEQGEFRPSRTILELLGIKERDFKNTLKEWRRLIVSEDALRVAQIVETTIKNLEGTYTCVYQVQGKKEQRFYVKETGRVTAIDRVGNPTIVKGVMMDVSESVYYEKRLEEERNQLNLSQEVSLTGSYSIELGASTFNYVSQQARINLELPLEGKISIDDLIEKCHPDDIALLQDNIEQVFNEQVREFEYRTLSKTGVKWLWAKGVPYYEKGIFKGVSAIAMDITERKNAELRALKSKARINALFNDIELGITYLDNQGIQLEANPQAEEILGYTLEEINSTDYLKVDWQALHGDGRPYRAEEYPASITLATGKPVHGAIMSIYNPRKKKRLWINIDTVPLQEKGDKELTGLYVIFKDITDEFETNKKILESEQKLEMAQRISKVGYWEREGTEDIFYWSQTLRDMFEGLLPAQSNGLDDYLKFIDIKDRERVAKIYVESVNSKESQKIEYTINLPTGNKMVEEVWEFIYDDKGELLKLLGVVHDVTSIKESEQRLLETSRAGQIGHWNFDIVNDRLDWTEECYNIFEVEKSKSNLNMDFFLSTIHPEDLGYTLEQYQSALKSGEYFSFEHRIVTPSGIKYVEESGRVILDNNGNPVRNGGIVKDITALKESEYRFVEASEAANLGHWKLNVATEQLWWSDQTYKIYGVDEGQDVNVELYWTLVHPEDVELAQEVFQRGLSETGVIAGQYRIVPNGETRFVEVSGKFKFDKNGDPFEATGIARDITEIKETEQRLQEASEAGQLGHWRYDIQQDQLWWSKQTYRLFEVDEKKKDLNDEFYKSFIHPEDLEVVNKIFEEAWKVSGSFSNSYRIIVNGRIKHIEISGKTEFDENNTPLMSAGIIKDITKIKETEQRLLEASRIAKLGYWHFEIESQKMWWSDEVYKIYEVEEDVADLSMESYLSWIHPEDLDLVISSFKTAIENVDNVRIQFRINTPNGVKYIETAGEAEFEKDGNALTFAGTVIDITDLKTSEINALKNKEKLNSILESMNELVFVMDDEGYYTDFYDSSGNEETAIPKDEIIGAHYSDVFQGEVLENLRNLYALVKSDGVPRTIEYDLLIGDKKEYYSANIARLKGVETGFTAVVRNITSEKRNEELLRISEEKYKQHSDKLPHILWVLNKEGNATYVNEQCQAFYGGNLQEVSKKLGEVIHTEDLKEASEKWQKSVKEKVPYVNTSRQLNSKGEYRWLQVVANPVFSRDKDLEGWIGVSTDITDQAIAQKENDALLEELSARVKETTALLMLSQAIAAYDKDLEGLLSETPDIVASGYTSPELTQVRLDYAGKVYGTKRITYKHKISAEIVVEKQVVGKLTVAIAAKGKDKKYLQFIKEEYILLSGFADNIALAISKYRKDKELQANESKFRGIFEHLQEGYFLLDTDGTILEYNPEACKLLACEGESNCSFSNCTLYELIDGDFRLPKPKAGWSQSDKTLRLKKGDGEVLISNFNLHTVKLGDDRWIFEATFRDITQSFKLNRLNEASVELYAAAAISVENLIQHGIDLAVEIMDSKCGFYHFVDEENGTIKLVQWSMGTKQVCKVPQLVPDYKIADTGIWTECIQTRKPVIHNDYHALKKKGGLPQGHFPIDRDLEVPIMEGDKVVGILGVGNKSTPYQNLDSDILLNYAQLFHSLVKAKQIEQKHIESLQLFEQSQIVGKIGTWKHDLIYDTFWWSDVAYDILRLSKDKPVPSNGWFDFIHPEDKDQVETVYQKALKKDGCECKFRVLNTEGEVVYLYVKSNIVRNEAGEAITHIGVVQDISDSVNQLHVLEEKNEQFESIVKSLNGFVYRMYQGAKVTYLSPAFENVTGYKRDDFLNYSDDREANIKQASSHIHKDDRELAIRRAEMGFKSNKDFIGTYRIKKADGTVIWVADNAKIIRDNNDKKLIQGYVYDVTERVKAEENIMNAVMKASDGEKTRISKEIHDSLQQTLTIAALNLEFIRKDEEQLSDFVKRKYNTGWEYLKKSMDETRAIAHRLMPKAIEDFGLVPVMRDMIGDLNKSSGIEFDFVTNMEKTRIQIPMATNLYKLIQEAINNILKHALAKYVTIQYMHLGEKIQLIIEDDGKGFDIKKLDPNKSGFGLASMRSRATALGAEFILDSFPGHGTTLMVEIPFTNDMSYYE